MCSGGPVLIITVSLPVDKLRKYSSVTHESLSHPKLHLEYMQRIIKVSAICYISGHSRQCFLEKTEGCFTNVSWALQNILSKFVYCRNRTSYENFKLRLCTFAQSYTWAHVQSFGLKFSSQMWLLALYIFRRLFWRARETLVKQPPDTSPGPWIAERNPCWTLC